MKKHNYDLLKAWLDEHWKECQIIMFNCAKRKGNITPWQEDENITDRKKIIGGFFLQNDLNSFKCQKKGKK